MFDGKNWKKSEWFVNFKISYHLIWFQVRDLRSTLIQSLDSTGMEGQFWKSRKKKRREEAVKVDRLYY